jgi:hypothetical protein
MVQLVGHQRTEIVGVLALGDVLGDFWRADDLTSPILDWRHGERNVDQAAILCAGE